MYNTMSLSRLLGYSRKFLKHKFLLQTGALQVDANVPSIQNLMPVSSELEFSTDSDDADNSSLNTAAYIHVYTYI